MKNNKHLVLRIFPFLKCNFSCSYCTAFNQYNKPINLKRDIIPAQDWLNAINVKDLYDTFDDNFRIVISGGEPGLYKELAKLCDGIQHKNVYVYSNISRQVFPRLMTIKKQVIFYPSFHALQEKKNGSNYKEWFQRVYELKKNGHKIMMPHSPDDGNLGSLLVMKTKIEDEKFSPYVNECRINSKELRKVECFTQQFVVDSAGEIFNCQSLLWNGNKKYSMGNIENVGWKDIAEWYSCDQCGSCHVCSQNKALKGVPLNDEWQLKIKQALNHELQARQRANG